MDILGFSTGVLGFSSVFLVSVSSDIYVLFNFLRILVGGLESSFFLFVFCLVIMDGSEYLCCKCCTWSVSNVLRGGVFTWPLFKRPTSYSSERTMEFTIPC